MRQKDEEGVYTYPDEAGRKIFRSWLNQYWFKKIGTKSFPIAWEGWLVWLSGGLFFLLSIEILRHSRNNLPLALLGWILPFLTVYTIARIMVAKEK